VIVIGLKDLMQDLNPEESDDEANKFYSCFARVNLLSSRCSGDCGQQGRFRPVDQGNMAGS
ncbi:uncharacterized protein METZ01_LOCUS426395, partial [marine metagenome]